MNIKQLRSKYLNMSSEIRASFWYTICNIINKAIALLATPIFTRILTEEQYGTFAIFQSWYSIIIIFTSLNIFLSSYQRGILLYKSDINRFTSSQLSLTTTITVLFSIIYIFNIDFWTKVLELSPILMVAMFIQLFTMPALEFWSTKERFNYRYRKYVLITLLMNILSLGCGVIAILNSELKVEARVYSDSFAKVLFAGTIFVIIMYKGKTFFHKEYWRYALVFNIPLIPHYLSNYILSQSDRLMIGRMVGNREAAFYSIAYTISTMMTLIMTAINSSLTPYIYKAIDEEREKSIKKVTEPVIILIAGLCILTMGFAPEVILVFAGGKYMEAVYVIPPIAASVFFIFIYSLFSNIEYFYRKTFFIAIATSISALINLVLNYIFIGIYGYYAAGYTTLICYICLAIIHYIFYKKILNKEMKVFKELYNIRLIVATAIGIIFTMLVMVLVYDFLVIRYGIIGGISILFIAKRNYFYQYIRKPRD
ncbi:MAG: oligosaccharide flippase family protein [Lachnospiraceae bacterium]|nr:oligosaccharide flippase family protein [Lachnospiraceae bacterium]